MAVEISQVIKSAFKANLSNRQLTFNQELARMI